MEITKTYSIEELKDVAILAIDELNEMLAKADTQFVTYQSLVPWASERMEKLKESRKKEIRQALQDIFENLSAHDEIRDMLKGLDMITKDMEEQR